MTRLLALLALLPATAFALPSMSLVGGEQGGIPVLEPDGAVVDVNTTGDRGGLVRQGVAHSYPPDAWEQGIEGKVVIQVLVTERGEIAPRKDERCAWNQIDAAERRDTTNRWHPRLCIQAVEGPSELGWPSTLEAARMKFRPLSYDGHAAPYYVKYEVDFSIDQ